MKTNRFRFSEASSLLGKKFNAFIAHVPVPITGTALARFVVRPPSKHVIVSTLFWLDWLHHSTLSEGVLGVNGGALWRLG